MRNSLLILIYSILSGAAWSQGVKVGDTSGNPDASSMFEIQSNSKGFLPPRMTALERDAINAPAEGLVIYNTTSGCLNMFTFGAWKQSCFECDFGTISISSNSPVCEYNNITLYCTSVPGASYLWTGPGGFSSEDQNPVIGNVDPEMAGVYSVTITKSGCVSDPYSTGVSVVAAPIAPVAASNSPVVSGQSISLTASLISNATYTWTGPSGFSSSEQNPTIPNAGPANAGVYQVTAAANGCSSSASNTTVSILAKYVFNYTGTTQSFEVPSGVTSVDVKMWGAGGGGASRTVAGLNDAGTGGGGGAAVGTIAVVPGESLTIIVGGGGGYNQVGGNAPGGYGGGGTGHGGGNQSGGGGGGRSEVRRGSTPLVLAGGGGGGGSTNLTGGAGGGNSGQTGYAGSNCTGGEGGTQSSGGTAGASNGNAATSGNAFSGGNGGGVDGAGGGGGAGYFGGGGGGGSGQAGCSGGGGSGYLFGLGNIYTGNIQFPAMDTDPDRGTAGNGGAQNQNGSNGKVIISFLY